MTIHNPCFKSPTPTKAPITLKSSAPLLIVPSAIDLRRNDAFNRESFSSIRTHRHMNPIQTPPLKRLAGEMASITELARLLFHYPGLQRQPRGNGETVLVLPGFGASDASTALLRRYLKRLGYQPLGWGLGRNKGQLGQLVPAVGRIVQQEALRQQTPIHLVGWSLGGYIAREVARDQPGDVAQVITFGSPVVGGPKYTVFAPLYERRGQNLDAIERRMAERNENLIRVPLTVIYSRRDGIVSWRACIDEVHSHAQHFEVDARHIGMGFSPEVFRRVAQSLAQPLQ